MYHVAVDGKQRIQVTGDAADLPGCSHAMVRGGSRGMQPVYGFCSNPTYGEDVCFCAHHGGDGAAAAAAMEDEQPAAAPAPVAAPFAMLQQHIQAARGTSQMADHTAALLQVSHQEHALTQQLLHGVQQAIADEVRGLRLGRGIMARVAHMLGADPLRPLHRAPPQPALPAPPPVQVHDVTDDEVIDLVSQLMGL